MSLNMKNRGQEHTIPLYASHLGDWIGGVMHTLENEIVSAEWCILRIFWDIVCPWLPRNLEQLTPRCDARRFCNSCRDISYRVQTRSKKRKLAFSPVAQAPACTVAIPTTPATPSSLVCVGIPQTDSAEDDLTTPPERFQPPPPPISQFCPNDSHKDLCHLCLKNPRYLMYDQCEFCYYRLKFAFKNCAFALVIIKNSLKNRKTNVLMVCTVDTTDIAVAVWCPRTPRSFSKIRKIRQPVCQGPRWV